MTKEEIHERFQAIKNKVYAKPEAELPPGDTIYMSVTAYNTRLFKG
jgi:hypothetical protein